MEGIMTSGRGGRPGLAGAAGKGYISPAGRKTH
jgi:hypothetical protein